MAHSRCLKLPVAQQIRDILQIILAFNCSNWNGNRYVDTSLENTVTIHITELSTFDFKHNQNQQRNLRREQQKPKVSNIKKISESEGRKDK